MGKDMSKRMGEDIGERAGKETRERLAEPLVVQVNRIAATGLGQQVSEKVSGLVSIIQLVSMAEPRLRQGNGGSKIDAFLQLQSSQQDGIASSEDFLAEVQALLHVLARVNGKDPLLAALMGFFGGDWSETLPSRQQHPNPFDWFCHYIEADLTGKLALLSRLLRQNGFVPDTSHGMDTVRAPDGLTVAAIEQRIRDNRALALHHFLPKAIDLLEILLPSRVCRFDTEGADKHRYRLLHEKVWRSCLALADPAMPLMIERNAISECHDRYYLDLLMRINGQPFEWFYTVDDGIDCSVFDDLKRTVQIWQPGSYLVETYGKSGYFAVAFLPDSVAHVLEQLV